MTLMAVRKISVSLDEHVLELARQEAAIEGKTLSAWLNDMIEHNSRIRIGLRAMDEWEAEEGAFTPEEIRQADEMLDRLGIRKDS